MTETWDFLQLPAASAPFNMALDEALLRAAVERRRPLLRVYSWEQPAVSIGYFQKFPAHLAGKIDIVRRPTGGGLVYHDEDTTYTVVVPPTHRLYEVPTADTYCAIHKAIAAALDVKSQIADLKSQTPRPGYECFQNPVRGDVVADGRKLAGAAQRRTKWGMLHQGSVAATLAAAQIVEGFRGELGVEFRPYELSTEESAAARWLTSEKYATNPWNKRVT